MGDLPNPIWNMVEEVDQIQNFNKYSTFIAFELELLRLVNEEEHTIDRFMDFFHNLQTDVERVDFVYENLLRYQLLEDKFIPDEKSDKEAKKHRRKGTNNFGEYWKALSHYTRAVMKAKSSAELYFAYFDRSELLLRAQKFEECIEDIERIFNMKYPESERVPLYNRRNTAETNKLLEEGIDTVLEFHTPIPEIPKDLRNSQIEGASNKITIVVDDNKRRVFATSDIEVGEVIAVEETFAFQMTAAYQYHCHYCFERCYNPIPCTECCQVAYCDDECRMKARELYHKYECPILLSLRNVVGDYREFLQALKMTLLAEEKNKNEVNLEDHKKILSLYDHANPIDPSKVFTLSVAAALIYNLVKKHTSKFSEPLDQSIDHGENTFKDLLLKHLRICMIFSTSIDEVMPNPLYDRFTLKGQEAMQGLTEKVGCGIYYLSSLLKHSCRSNVFGHCYGTKSVLRAKHSIQNGEECTISFGFLYNQQSKEFRQELLKSRYNIDCECTACENDWPFFQKPYVFSNNTYYNAFNIIRSATVRSSRNIIPLLVTVIKRLELENTEPDADLCFFQQLLSLCYEQLGNRREFR